jgi:hypothetical protein
VLARFQFDLPRRFAISMKIEDYISARFGEKLHRSGPDSPRAPGNQRSLTRQ